jgi:putative DNA methylase
VTTVRKKLIEVSIPLEAINAASAREKSIRHGHPSTLHLWWARRPLAACRAVLFAQLVDDPSAWPDRFPTEEAQEAERKRLHRVIEAMVPWEASNNEAILNAARWEIARSVAWGLGEEPPARDDGRAILDYLQTKAPPVYDPFSGGGSIPLEAQRLGLRAYGSDLNPVAVLIGKALVEIPPKFAGQPPVNPRAQAEAVHGQLRGWRGAQGLAEDVRYYGQWMRDEAERRIGHLYPKVKLGARASGPPADGTSALPQEKEATVIAWLWARTVRSPDPRAKGAMVPLVSSFLLSSKEGKKAWVEPVIDPTAPDGWRFEVHTGTLSKADEERLKKGTKSARGSNFVCILTGAAINGDHVKAEGVAGRMGARLMAIVAEGNRSRVYLSPIAEHEALAATARPAWTPDGDLPDDPRNFWTVQYGLKTFASLFTPRQLVALTTFSDLVAEAREKVLADALGARASRPHSPLTPKAEWHARRGLPHWEAGETPQSITFRLADSLPRDVIKRLSEARASVPPAGETPALQRQRFESLLDSGHGECLLARPELAAIVENALLHFHGTRYRLHAWCIMPNHVHVLATPLHGFSLSSIVHSWKSFTAKAINAALGRSGAVWFEEYFDRAIRDDAHFAAAQAYIEANPVKAGLCATPEAWVFSSAGEKARGRLDNMRAGRPRSVDEIPLHESGTGAAAYADAVATYLGFSVSKASTRSSALTIWEPGMGRLAGAMGRQALPMQWNYAETNPLAGAGGDIAGTAVSVAENLDNLGFGGAGLIRNLAAQSNTFSDEPVIISTDPPYYDNIGYADLSDFFYVWLRRSLGGVWPDLFRRLTTPKDEELIATPYRHGGREGAEAFFMGGMGQALAAMRKAATNSEPLAIYYAFKQSEIANDGITSAGWASFLQATVDAGLAVDGTWPIRTEATNALKANMNALASSIVLVCRKRNEAAQTVTRAEFIRALKREMPAAVDKIRKAGVGPVDMPQSIIGPGMGVFTRFARVLEDDDSAMSVKTALALINRVWGEIENDLDANFDPATQVALAWFATYGFDARASGDLITLANAKNIPVETLFRAGVFQNLHGKACLTPRSAGVPPAGGPEARAPSQRAPSEWTIWECVQRTAHALRAEDGGAEAAAKLVANMGPKAEDARALAYRLYEIASQKSWAAEALVYNELAQEWAHLEDLAARSGVRDLFGEVTR